MEKYVSFILFFILVYGCSKDNTNNITPTIKSNAQFITYQKFIYSPDYIEKINRDTFSKKTIVFEALDTSSGATFLWEIDTFKLKAKKVEVDFSKYPNSSLTAKLISHKDGFIDDTIIKTIYFKDFTLSSKLISTTKYRFINQEDILDTLMIELSGRIFDRLIDTISMDQCKVYVQKAEFTDFELATDVGLLWFESKECDSAKYLEMDNAFFSLKEKDKTQVELRFDCRKRISAGVWETKYKTYKFKGQRLN